MIFWHNYCYCYCKWFILFYYSLLLQLYCFLWRNPLNQRVWICSLKVINYCFEASHINIFEDAALSGQTWTKTFNHTKVLLASCGFLVAIPEFKHTYTCCDLSFPKNNIPTKIMNTFRIHFCSLLMFSMSFKENQQKHFWTSNLQER